MSVWGFIVDNFAWPVVGLGDESISG